MNQSEKRLFLIQSLLNERPSCQKQIIPADSERQKILLRGLMNVRRPVRIGADFLQVQDAYLQDETAAKGITDIADLTPIQPGLYLWQGDITTLKCDAIVNAANSGMTGCYIPNHRCIDNAIHQNENDNSHRLHREANERRLQPQPQKRPQVHRLQRGFQFSKHIRRNIGRALNEPSCLRDDALRDIEHGHDDIECV